MLSRVSMLRTGTTGLARLVAALIMASALAGCMVRNGPIERGFKAFDDKDYAKAELEFLKALEDDPEDPYAQVNLGAVYQNTARPELARVFYLKALVTGKDVTPSRKANTDETDKKKKDPTLAELAQINLDLLPPVTPVTPRPPSQ
jgi:tetratricopeptide (TPR) repeat protein